MWKHVFVIPAQGSRDRQVLGIHWLPSSSIANSVSFRPVRD